ncbi:MAG: hypothetical protein KF810_15930 [Rhizobiaceae bacterium]|nr:hypothetical protein [Rhizobiaceae bacterium]
MIIPSVVHITAVNRTSASILSNASASVDGMGETPRATLSIFEVTTSWVPKDADRSRPVSLT